MKERGAMRLWAVAWILVALATAAAAGAWFHLRSRTPPAPVVKADIPASPPPDAAAPADATSIPFAPRIYPATPPEAAAAAGPGGTTATPSGTATAAPPASGAVSSQALPAGTPAATVLERLKAAADAGDPAAACRVGLELLRCAQAPAVVSATTRGPQMALASCDGISAQQAQAGWSYVARAAEAGSEVARRVSQSRSAAGVSPAQCGR